MPHYSAAEICACVAGELTGPADVQVTGLAVLREAQPGHLTFLRDDKYVGELAQSHASAVLVAAKVTLPAEVLAQRCVIRVANADLALAKVLALFAPPRPLPPAGVHSTAVVEPDAQLGEGVAIGANCYVGARVQLGARCVLHPGVKLLADTTLGPDCELFPGVVVRERCRLGARIIIHSNAVIGADGFGYEFDPATKQLVKVPHIGGVTLGDDVELGAGACVDRGKMVDTVIGAGTKIDNLVQIAHNCRIGRCCIICGQTGLAGSVTLGDGVVLGGGVSVRDQVTIGAGAKVAGNAAVASNIPPGEVWGGYPAREAGLALRETLAVKHLPDLVKLHRAELRGKGKA